MLGELTGEDEADTGVWKSEKEDRVDAGSWNDSRGLDLTRRDGGLLVVCGELASLGCNTLEDVWTGIRKCAFENQDRID